MTTEVYPRFLRLAAGKLIAVVVTLAEYFNILIDTRHMNVNIYRVSPKKCPFLEKWP